jgi:hypothetical protein
VALLAWCFAAVFAGLSAVHVYWGAGGRRGISAAIPELDGAPLGDVGDSGALTSRAVGDFNHVGLFKRPRDTRFARLDTRFAARARPGRRRRRVGRLSSRRRSFVSRRPAPA